jgi:hypothetical protein
MHSLTSALDGGEWSASHPGHLTPRETAPDTHWVGDWVGPRASLDMVLKRKTPSPHQDSNPNCPARGQLLYQLSYPSSHISNNIVINVNYQIKLQQL